MVSYIYTNLPVNAIAGLPHPQSGDSQGQETFLTPSIYIALQINIISLPVTMNRKIKNLSQIELSAVTMKQQIKLVLQYFLFKNKC